MAELIKSGTRITQINERIGETQYDVLYPETRADVVQETFGSTVANWTAATSYKVGDNVLYGGLAYECKEAHTSTASFDATKWEGIKRRRFVTPEDEVNWSGGGEALKYKGVWNSTTTYNQHEVVKITSGGLTEYFISLLDGNLNKTPDIENLSNTAYWTNLNIWATNAKNANFVKVLKNDTGTTEHYLTFVDTSNPSPGNLEQLYTDTQLKYVPSENKLYTLAEFADKYKRTFTNALNLNTGTEQSPNHGAADVSISGEFAQVYEHLEELYGGSGHTLTIQKNGVVIGTYDPSADETINITIAHGDVTDWDQAVEDTGSNHFVRYDESQTLSQNQQQQARVNINAQIVGDYATLINGKVPSEQLPDWILGQMEYGGIVSLSSGADNGKIQSNNVFYNNKYLVKVPSENIAPWVSNTVYAINSYVTYNGLIYRYKASYTGSTFDYTKVDILPTTIYFNENLKGTFSASTAYSAGNIVLYNGAYYMFHTNHAAGAWSAAQVVPIWNSLISQQCNGTYFIVKADDINQGTIVDLSVQVGDWILSNGEMNWSIISNTDAVRTVNSQIGDVETYKGDWSSSVSYFTGDWVKYSGALYLAISSTNNVNKTPSTETTYWWIAGKVYTGAEGIKVEGTVVKHNITRAANDTDSINVAAKNGQFTVKEETLDAWGHSLKTTTKTITLSQTWREIKANGTTFLAGNVDTPINFADGNIITVDSTVAGTLKFNHPNTFIARATTTDARVENSGEVTFVTPGNDFYGHVNAQLNQKITNIVNLDGSQTITGVKTFGALEGTSNIAIILPGAHKVYDIGSPAKRFNVVYADKFDGKLEGIASNADKWTNARNFTIKVGSGIKPDGVAIEGSYTQPVDGSENETWSIILGDSGVGSGWSPGVTHGVYSTVQVNKQGIVTSGGQIVEFGTTVGADPSDSLVIGGLFFRRVAAPAL